MNEYEYTSRFQDNPCFFKNMIGHNFGYSLYKDDESETLKLSVGLLKNEILDENVFISSYESIGYTFSRYNQSSAEKGICDSEWLMYSSFFTNHIGFRSKFITRKITKAEITSFYNLCKPPSDEWEERVKTHEDKWWGEYDIVGELPVNSRRVLFLGYFPHSHVLKVGRTSDWKRHKQLYSQNTTHNPDTSGLMRIISVIPTIVSGEDVNIDEFLNWCSEDELKNYISKFNGIELDKNLGIEFYRVDSSVNLREFCNGFFDKYKQLTLYEVINLRSDYKVKQFVNRKSFQENVYNKDLLFDRIMKMRDPNFKTTVI